MLKIQDLPLDNREKNLDLLCFSDLYPFGINGQHDETRPIKLHDCIIVRRGSGFS